MASEDTGALPSDTSTFINDVLHEVAHYLPSQGPVKTFVHHNTLHHFEEFDFFDGVDAASHIFGARTALPESTYQEHLGTGRINYADINRVLIEYGVDGSVWLAGSSRRKCLRALLAAATVPLSLETLRWRMLERGALHRFSDGVKPGKISAIIRADQGMSASQRQEIFSEYAALVSEWEQSWLIEMIDPSWVGEKQPEGWTSRDSLTLLWFAAVITAQKVIVRDPEYGLLGGDRRPNTQIEELVNPYLIKFTASYLDTGLAHLKVSDRAHGLLTAFRLHMQNSSMFRPPWLASTLKRDTGKSGLEVLSSLLRESGVPETEWKSFLLDKALVLRGWGGLVNQSDLGIDGVTTRASLADFLAVRLLLERAAEEYFASHPQALGDHSGLLAVRPNSMSDQTTRLRTLAFHLYQAFQRVPWSGRQILTLSSKETEELVELIASFGPKKRLRVWQKSFEWNLYSRTASAILFHNREHQERAVKRRSPVCQVVCCIDDREESFRRYLEEISDEYQTFGTAGFFGVDAEFHSLYERPAPYCPVNVKPTHFVDVTAKPGSEQRLIGLQKFHSVRSEMEMFVEVKSRSLFRGWLLALGGLFALVPLSLSTLAPRRVHQFRGYLKRILLNPSDESAIVFAEDEDHLGEGRFTVEEMAHRVKTLLMTTGLSKELSPLVVIMGHGSFSTNNPYRSAYDCGACGGRPGRLNSRVFALMANRVDVRRALTILGIHIPESVYFLGAFHNTCTDEVEYLDTEALPDSHHRLFERLKADIDIARARNALERCRRFDDVSIKDVAHALAHVESRAHHIAQPRPEYGHATNALCIVGRRHITRGLFLDRRAFLVSYDKTVDPELAALRNLLRAVVPVCMGINLEYFFSAMDNQKYGAGTKLPHNVTSLLGLMTGYCSDLRTGLPAQMVEIHEATRLLFVIDQEPESIMTIVNSEADVGRAIKNHWVSVMAYSEEQNKIYVFDHTGAFTPFEEMDVGLKRIPTSLQWVAGKKDHLEFVQIG